jgi:enoyl-CoA hydratase/carnithine racemase
MIQKIKGLSYLCLNLEDERGTALTPAKIEHFLTLIQTEGLEKEVKCIILEGNATEFCMGFDLSLLMQQAFQSEDFVRFHQRFHLLLKTLETFPKPVIAIIRGRAKGGGVGLAAVADLTLATPNASFSLPETIMGMIPGVVFPFIMKRIGVGKARFLAIGGKDLTGEEADRWGLVDECCSDIEGRLKYYVLRLSRMESTAIGTMKRLISHHFDCKESYYEEVYQTCAFLLSREQVRKRVNAFYQGFAPWNVEENEFSE